MSEGAGIFASLKRALASWLDIVASRVELLANEWEEERLRLAQALFFALFAFFCFCMGILFLSILIVLFFWQDHPMLVAFHLALAFFAASLFFCRMLSGKMKQKPVVFADTLNELKKDIHALRGNHE